LSSKDLTARSPRAFPISLRIFRVVGWTKSDWELATAFSSWRMTFSPATATWDTSPIKDPKLRVPAWEFWETRTMAKRVRMVEDCMLVLFVKSMNYWITSSSHTAFIGHSYLWACVGVTDFFDAANKNKSLLSG